MPELIVALDVPTAAQAEAAASALAGRVRYFKVGLELFTAEGPRAVERVARHGRVFLDLKLHDIPNTVAAAAREAGRLGVYALSVHLSGGREMLEAAAAAPSRPKLWGISLLTSLADLSHLGSAWTAAEAVERLAALGRSCGLDGAVCSGAEAASVKKAGLAAVVPGVRPKGSSANDQSRVVTPSDAARLGADFLVVGRPILHAADPSAAAAAILEELAHAG